MKWPYIDPGTLIHQIQLQTKTIERDSFGQKKDVWNTTLSLYASIEPVRGIDLIRSGQQTNQLYLKVSFPYVAGVLPSMRGQAANGVYQIESIENPLDLGALLILTCLAVNTAQ